MSLLKSRLPLILVLISAFGFSIQSLLLKVLFQHGFSGSIQCVFARGIIQLITSSLILYYDSDRKTGKAPRLFGDTSFITMMLFLRSIVGFGGITFSFLSVEYLPIGDSTVLQNLSPVFATIGSYFVLGESWRLPEFVATVLSLFAAAFVARPPSLFGGSNGNDSGNNLLGLFYAFMAAATAGLAYLCIRILGTTAKVPWVNILFAQSLGQVFLSFPSMYAFGEKVTVLDMTGYEYVLIISSGLMGTLSQIAMTVGMQREKSANATVMRMSEVLFGFLWQLLLTDDPVNLLSVLGSVLITVGVMIIVVFKQSEDHLAAKQTDKQKKN
jgi:drug/metabolite transporter (DMT)-like permease